MYIRMISTSGDHLVLLTAQSRLPRILYSWVLSMAKDGKWQLHSLFGQPVPGFGSPHSKRVFVCLIAFFSGSFIFIYLFMCLFGRDVWGDAKTGRFSWTNIAVLGCAPLYEILSHTQSVA